MDAKVNNIPVTPRNGKAVEINALWYNALRIMQKLNLKWNHIAGQVEYAYLANKCRKSFIKDFYNPNKKCLYDVIKEVKKENPKASTIDNRYSFIQQKKMTIIEFMGIWKGLQAIRTLEWKEKHPGESLSSKPKIGEADGRIF